MEDEDYFKRVLNLGRDDAVPSVFLFSAPTKQRKEFSEAIDGALTK